MPSVEPDGPPIATGRAADVYALDEDRVLRRYREAHDVSTEADAMVHVARHGYPVPAVHDADGRDIVMDRIRGPTMLERLGRRPWEIGRHARTLADLQRDLADVPVPSLPLATVEHPGAPPVVVHGDHHPDNVILGPDGPVVIDWSNVHVGPRGADTANTWALTHGADPPTTGPLGRLTVRFGRGRFLAAFLAASDVEEARRALPLVVELRSLDRNLIPSELERMQALADEVGSR